MKRFLLLVLVFALALAACAPKTQESAAAASGPGLKVSDGKFEKTYTMDDLKALGTDEAPFRMVLPNEGGKLNPRMVVEIVAVP